MDYKLKRQLRKLGDRQFAEDIKRYIRSSHEFYEMRMPELKTLAKRLHEEYNLNDFYKVFNKLWNSGYHGERTLAIYTLQLYKEELNIETWKYIKPKLKYMKSWDLIDSVSLNIIGIILSRSEDVEKEIINFSKGNIWFKRIAIISNIPLIKEGKINLAMIIAENCINEKNENLEKALGNMLKEVGNKDEEVLKSFILKNIHNIPQITFNYATEHMKELRKLRGLKSLKNHRFFSFNNIRRILRIK